MARVGAAHPVLGHQVQVKQPGLGEPAAVLSEQVIDGIAPLLGEDRLSYAECTAILTGKETIR